MSLHKIQQDYLEGTSFEHGSFVSDGGLCPKHLCTFPGTSSMTSLCLEYVSCQMLSL